MSKYQEIYLSLKNQINNKTILANTYLPSESELMKKYHASRDTVRKSLNLLLEDGMIVKEKGKGSRVVDFNIIAFPVSGVSSFKELKQSMSGEVKTYVTKFEYHQASQEECQHLNISEGNIYHIERVREIDFEKVILDIDYLNGDIIKGLNEKIAKDSLYEYIEKQLGLKISFAKKEITVIKATQEEKKLLDMNEFDLLVCVKSYTYLEDATLFQYTISKHRPDKFRFVDFAKRTR